VSNAQLMWIALFVRVVEEARCVRSNSTALPSVTAFVQGPNGQYFVPGECFV